MVFFLISIWVKVGRRDNFRHNRILRRLRKRDLSRCKMQNAEMHKKNQQFRDKQYTVYPKRVPLLHYSTVALKHEHCSCYLWSALLACTAICGSVLCLPVPCPGHTVVLDTHTQTTKETNPKRFVLYLPRIIVIPIHQTDHCRFRCRFKRKMLLLLAWIGPRIQRDLTELGNHPFLPRLFLSNVVRVQPQG